MTPGSGCAASGTDEAEAHQPGWVEEAVEPAP
jgi:hypothetical protein